MKNTLHSNHIAPPTNTGSVTAGRYQVYCQTHIGTYTVEFKTDSAADAVQAFLHLSPAFEGGELRLWDHVEGRLGASVEWRKEKTDFGFTESPAILIKSVTDDIIWLMARDHLLLGLVLAASASAVTKPWLLFQNPEHSG